MSAAPSELIARFLKTGGLHHRLISDDPPGLGKQANALGTKCACFSRR